MQGYGIRPHLVVALVVVLVTTLGAAASERVGSKARSVPDAEAAPGRRAHGFARAERQAPSDGESVESERERPEPFLLVAARPGLVGHAFPSRRARELGEAATHSRFYGVPVTLWVEETRRDGRWGRVELPYVFPRRDAWIPLRGLRRTHTWVSVEVDLSEHVVRVFKRGEQVMRVLGATGAPASPTPPGNYFVTDRVPFPVGSSLGSFAFGISGIQPQLPAGWTGGDQLAIHGTDSPATIGRSVSAGCVRVGEPALARLRPMLKLGTPVTIHP